MPAGIHHVDATLPHPRRWKSDPRTETLSWLRSPGGGRAKGRLTVSSSLLPERAARPGSPPGSPPPMWKLWRRPSRMAATSPVRPENLHPFVAPICYVDVTRRHLPPPDAGRLSCPFPSPETPHCPMNRPVDVNAWTRSFRQSATYTFPSSSHATPQGVLNCPDWAPYSPQPSEVLTFGAESLNAVIQAVADQQRAIRRHRNPGRSVESYPVRVACLTPMTNENSRRRRRC